MQNVDFQKNHVVQYRCTIKKAPSKRTRKRSEHIIASAFFFWVLQFDLHRCKMSVLKVILDGVKILYGNPSVTFPKIMNFGFFTK